MEKPPLTPQEDRCLRIIYALLCSGTEPSFTRVAKVMGITKGGAQKHMGQLRAKGYLRGPRVKVVGSWLLTPRGSKELGKVPQSA